MLTQKDLEEMEEKRKEKKSSVLDYKPLIEYFPRWMQDYFKINRKNY